jgi:alpha-amylase
MLQTPIKPTFMALAYALILLRKDGYPCVFYGDLYGLCEPHPSPPTCWGKLPDLILARKLYAYGEQVDYFERRDCVGWTRSGRSLNDNGPGIAIVMSWDKEKPPRNRKPSGAMDKLRQAFQPSSYNTASSSVVEQDSTRGSMPLVAAKSHPNPHIRMKIGKDHAGETWRDLLGWEWANVTIDAEGYGVFPCQPNSLAVFAVVNAQGREQFPVQSNH